MTNRAHIATETTTHLQELLRLDTTNPPGNELPACEYVSRVLAREGIDSTILAPVPDRANIVARLKGDGRAAPLLLMAHLDVVPAEPSMWTHPPFGGEIADGYLYGRGALDTKQLAAMELAIMTSLKRESVTLARDVILMLNADEEAGGNFGAGWMVANHAELIRSEFAINEGGGFSVEVMGKRFFTVQTGEKGTARFILRARGRPGHGSQPHNDNAVLKLADALSRLGAHKFPVHSSNTVRVFIEQISSECPPPMRDGMRAILDPRDGNDALARLPLENSLRSMLYALTHNTATPTILSAGSKVNVIPSVAEAQVDSRLIPGITQREWERELREVIPPHVEVEFFPSRMGIESEPRSLLFDRIVHVMGEQEPHARVVPYLSVGATDARHVTRLGTRVCGFCPLRGEASELDRIHAHDERISLQDLEFGSSVLYQVVREITKA